MCSHSTGIWLNAKNYPPILDHYQVDQRYHHISLFRKSVMYTYVYLYIIYIMKYESLQALDHLLLFGELILWFLFPCKINQQRSE